MTRVLVLSGFINNGQRTCPECSSEWLVQFPNQQAVVFRGPPGATMNQLQPANDRLLDAYGNNVAVRCCEPEE